MTPAIFLKTIAVGLVSDLPQRLRQFMVYVELGMTPHG